MFAMTNYDMINNGSNDFYPEVEQVQVTKLPRKILNFKLEGNEITKVIDLDKNYSTLETINFNLISDQGMWVKTHLLGQFPQLNTITVKSNTADFALSAENNIPNIEKLIFTTNSGDTFINWQAKSKSAIDLIVNTRSGDTGLILSESIKNVALSSRSGEIYLKWKVVDPASSLKIDNSSGDIHANIENGINTARFHTKSGDIDLNFDKNWQVNSEFSLATKTGDIMITIPEKINFLLSVLTATGEVEFKNLTEIKSDSKARIFTQQISAEYPTINIQIETRTGDVLLQ